MSPAVAPTWSVVVPTVGRPSLGRLLDALLAGDGPRPLEVVLADDRRRADPPLATPTGAVPVRVVATGGRGPAAARNAGWRAAGGEWVVFLDDDVVPPSGWGADLEADLAAADPQIAASQGRITVPLPAGRRPTDWERNTAGLERAVWATADMAYRRSVLEEVGGFDERFPRAFREDADLGLRVSAAGYLIVSGARTIIHPVRPAGRTASIRAQAGNADDVLMRALHGPGWRQRCGAEPGRTGRHLGTVAAAAAAAVLAAAGRRRAALAAGAVWAAGVGELAAARVRPGQGTPDEVATMVATSLALPFCAVWHLGKGVARLRGNLSDTGRAPLGVPRTPLALAPGGGTPRAGRLVRPGPADPGWRPEAILFDRDGTLVVDVPYNRDPARVVAMPGARVAAARAREAGLAVGVVTNQSGVGKGLISPDQLDAVNARVEELLGPFDTWAVCPHRPDDGCACRKPAPGLIRRAAGALGVDPARCAVIGDIAGDVEAAAAAGARSVLVPTARTRREEIERCGVVAPDVLRAVDMVVAGTC